MICLKTKTLLAITIATLISGCASKYDYSIHKPKVRFKPSERALDKLNRETLGHPYVWGAENAGKYDCSGLTYYSFGSMGIEIPRVANKQFHSGTPIARSNLEKGDLVFFATSRRRPGVATHVGIYLGNGEFEHASSAKKRVIVSSLNKPYYAKHYIGARRYHAFNREKVLTPTYYAKAPKPKPLKPNFKELKPTEVVVANTQNNNVEPTNPFIEADSIQEANYFLVINPQQDPSAELTKLELSGLSAQLTSSNQILVGPFSSQSQAQDTKNRNIELLANSTIRG